MTDRQKIKHWLEAGKIDIKKSDKFFDCFTNEDGLKLLNWFIETFDSLEKYKPCKKLLVIEGEDFIKKLFEGYWSENCQIKGVIYYNLAVKVNIKDKIDWFYANSLAKNTFFKIDDNKDSLWPVTDKRLASIYTNFTITDFPYKAGKSVIVVKPLHKVPDNLKIATIYKTIQKLRQNENKSNQANTFH